MSVIYIDILYIINSLTTYFLLLIAAKLSGAFLRRKNHIWASLLSGLISVIVFFAPSHPFLSLILRIFMCITIVSAAFTPSPGELFRLSGIFFITSLCMGGLVFLLSMLGVEGSLLGSGIIYFNMNYTRLFIGFFAGYVIFDAILGRGGMVRKGQIVSVEAAFPPHRLSFSAMVDTGNLLTEPVTKKPVILISPELAEGVTFLGRDYPVFIRTAADGFQIIHTYEPASLVIDGKPRDDFMIGIAGTEIRGLQGTRAIIGGAIWQS